MNKLTLWCWLLLLGLGLAGCDLARDKQVENDIAAFVPPVPPTEAAAVAQAGAMMRLEPATRQINGGDVVAVEVRIDHAPNLTAAGFQIQFNPAILQVQDADASKDGAQIQPGNFPPPEFVAVNVVTNTTGLINYAVTDIAPFELTRESGLLATLTFQAIAQGRSDLIFTEAALANNVPQSISVSTQSGQITVGQGPTSTPTFTPLPGQATATFTPIPTITPIIPTPMPIPPTSTPSPTFTPFPTATNTPAAPAVEIPSGATVGFCYRVQPGETLSSLGEKFGMDPEFIRLVNDLYPPRWDVFPQQVLFMPQEYGTGPNVYQVQPGDTLRLIAEQCRLPADFLAAVNGLPENANLSGIGTLIIPRPPYTPPSRYPYPGAVWPPVCPPSRY